MTIANWITLAAALLSIVLAIGSFFRRDGRNETRIDNIETRIESIENAHQQHCNSLDQRFVSQSEFSATMHDIRGQLATINRTTERIFDRIDNFTKEPK